MITTFERIKMLAKEQNMNVKELAIKLDFGENAFYKWKSSSPGIENIQKVADYFSVSIDYLLGRTDIAEIAGEKEHSEDIHLINHLRINTTDLDADDVKAIEKELKDYTDYLIKNAKHK